MSDLNTAVQSLAQLRRRAATAKEILAEIEIEIGQRYGASIAAARTRIQNAQHDVIIQEGKVWARAFLEFHQHGHTNPHPAITIEPHTILDYPDCLALNYCIKHLPSACTFDRHKFESAAKILQGLPFVCIDSEPRATIKRDLSEWLPGEEGDDG